MTIVPDTKDWTWVLDRPCPECGFEAATVDVHRLPTLLRENAVTWLGVLARPEVATRPAPAVWSPLEYACHVRDVHQVFDGRVAQMLTEDDPAFASWDQDASAVEGDYAAQVPAEVAADLVAAAEAMAARYAAVTGDQWQRTGRRSDGAVFTVAGIGRYQLHDVVHHVWDVGT